MIHIVLSWCNQILIFILELVGTPGYLAPELLKTNMFEGADGYSKEVDL